MKFKTTLFLACAVSLSGVAGASDLGYESIQQGNWVAAETQLRTELSENPHDPMRLLNLAYVLQSQGKSEEAAQVYQTVLELDQDPLVDVGSDKRARPMRAKLVARKGMSALE